jgi:hypothetical protein
MQHYGMRIEKKSLDVSLDHTNSIQKNLSTNDFFHFHMDVNELTFLQLQTFLGVDTGAARGELDKSGDNSIPLVPTRYESENVKGQKNLLRCSFFSNALVID